MISTSQAIIVIAICGLITGLERVLPFLIFRGKNPPEIISYIGKTLPMAIMAIMIIFCFKNISFDQVENFVPQIIAGAVTFAVHLWKRNMILTIAVGTILYMVLIQLVF